MKTVRMKSVFPGFSKLGALASSLYSKNRSWAMAQFLAGRSSPGFVATVAVSVFLPTPSLACSPVLQGARSPYISLENGDLCRIADRFQTARASLRAKGVDARHLSDVRAPRLVNMPDWRARTSGWFGDYDPTKIYDNTGVAWKGWSQAAEQVDAEADLNYLQNGGRAQVGIEWLRQTQQKALVLTSDSAIAGIFRSVSNQWGRLEVGRAFLRSMAPTLSQISNLQNLEYKSLANRSQGLITWVNTLCLEDQSQAVQKAYQLNSRDIDFSLWKDPGRSFVDDSGQARHCGYFIYPGPAEVQPQLTWLFQDLVPKIATLGRGANSPDILLMASRAERWSVSIHPFLGGDGRASRFLMDDILESAGLPAPTLANMDLDYLTPEGPWAQQIGLGIERVLQITESCARDRSQDKCRWVP